MFDPTTSCVLNSGSGAWAFETLARRLADAIWIDISANPRSRNYLLFTDDADPARLGDLFIPWHSMRLAADKRLLADVFEKHGVPTPTTRLVGSLAEAKQLASTSPAPEWCLKFPTSCGGSGHRLLTAEIRLPGDWPLPLVVQEFIPSDRPEVFRTYVAGGEMFGWIARRFPLEAKTSPWVAHARGARYERAGSIPDAARDVARAALVATGLFESFGCVDLIRRPGGEWLVLEVGTDGMFNHVDRDLNDTELELLIDERIAEAFWKGEPRKPWQPGPWRPRSRK